LPLEIALEITANERNFGKLTLAWRDGRSEVNRDEELALELVADSIAKATRDVISQGRARSPLPAAKRPESQRMN
jgi:UDP-GlcNAc:undecaprenyl-phosphate GlcNAc-1-phosphate transferase